MTGDETGPQIQSGASDAQIQLSADEDWKNRVKAEDAAIDQQFRDEKEGSASASPTADKQSAPKEPRSKQPTGKPEAPQEFPEATFEALVAMLATQAMVALGAVRNPATEKAERQLPLARYMIDLLGVLEQRTNGNRSPDESAALDEALHSLRMMYVQSSKMTA
jgi:Domain of unknown function (DUF1844)